MVLTKDTVQELLNSGEITKSQYLSIVANLSKPSYKSIKLLADDKHARIAFMSAASFTGQMTETEACNFMKENTNYSESSIAMGRRIFTKLVGKDGTWTRTLSIGEVKYMLQHAIDLGLRKEFTEGMYRWGNYGINAGWLKADKVEEFYSLLYDTK